MEKNELTLSDVHVAESRHKIGSIKVPDEGKVAAVFELDQDSNSESEGQNPQSHSNRPQHPHCDRECCQRRSETNTFKTSVILSSDQVLSEGLDADNDIYEVCRSRFTFHTKSEESNMECQMSNQPETDEDGDLVVQRHTRQEEIIYIDHAMGTRLAHVGLQVWQGCLLLCDFILDRRKEFDGVTALELGAGVGLASIVMATVAKQVICTDVGDSVLALCERNASINQSFIQNLRNEKENRILVRELDWNNGEFPEGTNSIYKWQPRDVKLLRDVSILIAADVVYDPDLTEAFLNTVVHLMSTPPAKVLYIALERRMNFTLGGLEVACAAYDHFVSCMEELTSGDYRKPSLRAYQIALDFPQRFDYERTPNLVLWKIMRNENLQPV